MDADLTARYAPLVTATTGNTPSFIAVGERRATVPEAIGIWFLWIVVLSGLFAVIAPLFIPFIHSDFKQWNLGDSFGKGELLGAAFAILAAAASRWNAADAAGGRILRGLSIFLFGLSAIALALIWGDNYQAKIHTKPTLNPDPKLIFTSDEVFKVSLVFFAVSLAFGLLTEVLVAASRRKTAL